MSLSRHCPKEVASLIHESAPDLFALLFGAQAIESLTTFVPRSNNRFSHRYIRVAEIGDRVVGILVMVPAAHLSNMADEDEVFSFGQKLWLKVVRQLLLRYVLRHDYPSGSFYIGNFAVAAEYRNQGIGRRLLEECIADVKRMIEVEGVANAEATSSTLFISVDVSNQRAQKLYESLGFRVTTEKTLRLLGKTIGSRVLCLSIPESEPIAPIQSKV